MHFFQKYTEDGFEIIELNNDLISARIIVNIGNTLFSLKQNEVEKMYFPFSFDEYKSNTKLAGNPFMHPWSNRLDADFILVDGEQSYFPTEKKSLIYRDGNQLPLHGLLLKTDKWETIDLYEDANVCWHLAELNFVYADWLSIFPFKHKIQIKHQLKDNELTIETIIINEDEKMMPVHFGFHPYFLKTDEVIKLTIPAKNIIEVDDKMIPTGNSFAKENVFDFENHQLNLSTLTLDNGFEHLIYNENNQAEFLINDLKIIFDKNYSFAQIYAPNKTDKPYVCVEPMTSETNAINKNSCKMLAKNEVYQAIYSIVL